MVTVVSMEWVDPVWRVRVTIETAEGTRAGDHEIAAAEDATVAEISAAVLALYE